MALSLAAPASASDPLLPMKKPEIAARKLMPETMRPVAEAWVLPRKKPSGMMEAALAEGMRATSFIGKVLTDLTTSRRISEDDAARYQHIFAFQDTGSFAQADAEIAKLEDGRLMGHVLFQRYMSKEYKAAYAELAAWMKKYADHPGAQQIYDLAMKKKPASAPAPAAPSGSRGVLALHDFDVGQLAQPYIDRNSLSPRERDLARAVRAGLGERPTAALKRLEAGEAGKLFEAAEYDTLQAEIAESYFYNGKTAKALEYANRSLSRSGADVPKAGWIAGLAAWKQGQYAAAARAFEVAAASRRASAWMAAASAYWAARAHLRAQEPAKVAHWLARAAQHPRTFYGIIATKALGMEQASFNWDLPEMEARHEKFLARHPAGLRALALADAGKPELAEQELSRLSPAGDEGLQQAMIAFARQYGMPGLAMRMGSAFKDGDGDLYDGALYPDVPWTPEKGFQVDRALVYAFIRQESRFDSAARNRSSGATGLMQLMPATAAHVARASGEKIDLSRLKDPLVNIDLGQKYLAELLRNEHVDNNLFKLAVAYNAGPGKLARWEKSARYEDDPLLFIESIPAAETRIFVERVIANYWIYRIKFGQDTESLDRVAEGQWPDYVAQDIRRGSVFAEASTVFAR
jgi:soluble lytic murein transglycosylase-like protein